MPRERGDADLELARRVSARRRRFQLAAQGAQEPDTGEPATNANDLEEI